MTKLFCHVSKLFLHFLLGILTESMHYYHFCENLKVKVSGIIQISLADITKQILSKLMRVKAVVSKLNLVSLKYLLPKEEQLQKQKFFSLYKYKIAREVS